MMSASEGTSTYLTPLVIGVTGHRDLVPEGTQYLEAKVEALLNDLRRRFPNTPLRLMSALAEGADRLAARVALRRGVEVQVVLPLPEESYRADFPSRGSQSEFDEICARAKVLHLSPAGDQQAVHGESGPERDIAYANAGIFISAHCHILLALWDGQDSDQVGGTAQIVYFQHYDRLPGVTKGVPRTPIFLTNDESDLVYHIPSSRQSTQTTFGQSSGSAQPAWFTTDPQSPRSTELPQRYARVFERTDQFNADVKWILQRRHFSPSPTLYQNANRSQPASDTVGRVFNVTDALADHFQRRVNVTLRSTHALAVLTGIAFILYSEVSNMDLLIVLFLLFLLAGIGVAGTARHLEWHRKYLDYRVLAEGLRVQFFWTIAGIRGEGQTKFAYDNFLRQRDMELGWIRNVMRVAGTIGDAHSDSHDPDGIHIAIDNWIGDGSQKGQLQYYATKAQRSTQLNRYTSLLTLVCLWGGILIASLLALFHDTFGNAGRDPLIILMGVLPLFAAVMETYTQRKATRELTKQFQFMRQVFSKAKQRLDQSSSEDQRREVLRALGDAALTEHAEWILTHRDRKPEVSGF